VNYWAWVAIPIRRIEDSSTGGPAALNQVAKHREANQDKFERLKLEGFAGSLCCQNRAPPKLGIMREGISVDSPQQSNLSVAKAEVEGRAQQNFQAGVIAGPLR
jgi:hypothetical protein